jgi:hypothetical membrane protein
VSVSLGRPGTGRAGSSTHLGSTSRLRWLGGAGVGGGLAFLGTLVVLHLLRADLDPVANYVSDYANGPHGGLFTVSTITHGAGNLAVAAALWVVFAGSRSGRWGAALLAVSALGMLVVGMFPTDAPGASPTTVGTVHQGAATIAFPVELVAVVLLTPALRVRLSWRVHAQLTRVVSVLAAASLVWLVAAQAAGWPQGLPERATLAVFLAWEVATGLRLLIAPPAARVSGGPSSRRAPRERTPPGSPATRRV